MKILHVIAGLRLSYLGGVSNYVRMLANAQYNNGDEIWVLGEKDVEQYPFRYYSYETKKIRLFTIGKMEDKIALNELEEFLAREKFDIIHLHAAFNLDWDFSKVLASYCYIISLHDYFYLCPRGAVMITPQRELCCAYSETDCKACIGHLEQLVEKYWLLRKACGFFRRYFNVDVKSKLPHIPQEITAMRFEKMKQLLEGAKLLLPVSKRTQEIYENSGIANYYKVLYIGNIYADKYTEKYLLSPLNEDNKIHLAMVGELVYMKGADILLKLMKFLDRNKYIVHFYGKSDNIYRKKIEKSGVIFHGKYRQQEISDILKKIDVGLVLPVCEDAGPQVVMELLNNHIPVVATWMGGIPDFVDDSNGFLFNPYDECGFSQVVDFFDKLTFDKINLYKENIQRTTTSQEHYSALNKTYQSLLQNEIGQ